MVQWTGFRSRGDCQIKKCKKFSLIDSAVKYVSSLYCSLQVGCHSQWFMLDSVVSMVDIVWSALAIHGFSVLRNRYHVSLIAYALILVRYHKQARAVFTLVQWLCKIASNRSSLLIAIELELMVAVYPFL